MPQKGAPPAAKVINKMITIEYPNANQMPFRETCGCQNKLKGMQMLFRRLLLVLLLTAVSATAQQLKQKFVIDASKPYVYLKFDHIAERKPLSPLEPPTGIWLRLVNNCRLPITIAIFNPETGDPGLGVFDEVIPVRPGEGAFLQHREDDPKETKKLKAQPPEGYSSEVASTTIVAPGDNLLFSVPLNHVSKQWFLRIKFNLDLPGTYFGTEPYSLVSFRWQDIPEKLR